MKERKFSQRLLTIGDAADLTGYSKDYLRRLTRLGKIKAIRPNGGKLLIAEAEMVNFLNGGGADEAES